MKKISLLILTVGFLISPNITLAQSSPSVSIIPSKTKEFATLNFQNIRNVKRIDYTFTYEFQGQTKGVEGRVNLNGKTTRTTRRQILGTCSTRRCVYHRSAKNLSLSATLTTSDGKKITINSK